MNALNIKGLTKVYKGGTRALNGINLEVKPVSYTHLTLPTTPYV